LGHRDGEQPPAGAQKPAAGGRAPDPGAIGPGPSEWLRPGRGVVPFTGRTAELGELWAWCAADRDRSVLAVAGTAGSGKTRLALEIAGRWEADGARWVLAAPGDEARAVGAARARHAGRLLIVVDRAETRGALGELLRAAAADPGPIRVLLLTRVLGEWWERLAGGSAPEVAALLAGDEPVLLDAPVRPDVPDAVLAEDAVPYVADALGVGAFGRPQVERAARRLPVLVLHAATLGALLRFVAKPGPAVRVVVSDEAIGELLEHEARHWRRAASAAGLPEADAVVSQFVAAAAVTGARSVEELAAAAERVPRLAGGSAQSRLGWAEWLAALYPADADRRTGELRPDLLAETLAVRELAADPELARACLRDLAPEQAERAFAMLAGGFAPRELGRQVIGAALRRDLAELAVPAARAALRTTGELPALLASAIADAVAPADVLSDVALGMPYPSATLTQAHLAATLRVLQSLPDDVEPEMRARWDDRAGQLLSELERQADAVHPAHEAVTIRRALTAGDPGRYGPALAASLISLGARFADAGRPADALLAEREAVAIYRELASADPFADRASLAGSLAALAVRYGEMKRPADAVAAGQEAVAAYRTLAAGAPGLYDADLAAALANLSVWFAEAGRAADAVPPARQAVASYRELAGGAPGQYADDLAAALTNLGIWLAEVGRAADAVSAEQEAAAIRRELAAGSPERYRPELARSLENLGAWHSELGSPADAVPVEREAVAIRRELASAGSEPERAALAATLLSLGISYAQLGRPADALPPVKEAVTTYRALAEAAPDRYRPQLARALTVLAFRYRELGRSPAGLPQLREAVRIRRRLAEADPDRYRRDLARSLTNLGARLADLDRRSDALPPLRDAVAAYRELAAANPGRYGTDLAEALARLAGALSGLGQQHEAAEADAEAAAVAKGLATTPAGGPPGA
jgi:hypothetical protein